MSIITPKYKIAPERAEYKIVMISGTIASGLAAGANVWAVLNNSSTLGMIIRRIRIDVTNVVTFATAQNTCYSLYFARAYTVAAVGGTAATLTGNNGKLDTKYPTTAVGDLRISATAALTAGTWTLDTQPLEDVVFYHLTVGSVTPMFHDLFIGDRPGVQPIILRQNEGLTIQNRQLWAGAGTNILSVTLEWAEVVNTIL